MNRDDLLRYRSEPNVAAFLRLIRRGESSEDDSAYSVMFGGGHFDSFTDHPRIVNKSGNLSSTAAGAYQFIERTWDGMRKQYSLPDFSPENQDCAAIGLIARRGALDDVEAGRVYAAIRKCSSEWASLPGSQYGQPTQRLQNAIATYLQYGGTLAAEADALPAPPRKETVMAPIVLPILEALSGLIPQLGSLFAKGDVAQRNVAAGTIVSNAITEAVGAVNLQEAAEKIQQDPQALQAAKDAVAKVWPDITETGGGITKAREAAAAPDQIAFYKNPAFLIALVLIPLIYMVAVAVLFGYGGQTWSDEIKAMVVTGIIAGLMGSITGFFLGSSLGSQKKDALIGK